ncbi:hypothetical protein NFIA_036930 [Paecilomyces variotii No. 5]|uniref:Protein FAF1 n=1 Tax=Byssochlamys spectabilis (strain No. 5 / NBRC 109023) TaxID=1356009 RepID=V5GAH8_BYSSN|nr:hypothetical protein NFIA_036930 [Paecilomyces variotii No. 5]
MPGKRKREAAAVSRSDKVESSESRSENTTAGDAHDIFRRYFESQFEPLDLPPIKSARTAESEASESEEGDQEDDGSDESGSEWDGISDAEGNGTQVEVVEYTSSHNNTSDEIDKKARKAFMNAKPPDLSKPVTAKSTSKKEEEASDDDAMDLKNDLALQRLLKESHLLESGNDLDPTGKNRHKALDLRVQSLGAKASLFTQEKMPMAHRKGIKGKAATKEDRRRREAKENGIILEKPIFKTSKSSGKKRERGIGGPSIGKFAGGTLNLSKGDIMSIQGPRKSAKGKKGRR